MSRLIFAALVPICLLLSPLAQAQIPDSDPHTAGNAALQYWQAFALMPTLDKEQEELVGKWTTVSLDDPQVMKLVENSRTSLMFLHRGAAMANCEWGLKYDDGMGMLMPHMSRARDLARLAALRGRYEFERGNWKVGRNDAQAIVTLGRHVGREPVLIARLVGLLIEDLAIDLTAPYLLEHKAPYPQAMAMFEALPPAATLSQTILVEKKYMCQWAIDTLKKEEKGKAGAGLELWKKFIDGAKDADALAKMDKFDEILKRMEEVVPVYDELAGIAALPKAEFDARYPKFREQAKGANPVVGLLLPAIDQVLAKDHRHKARFALLFAAIAVAQDGPAKLKEIKDPYGDGPFEYKALDKGFELKSKLLFEGQPVTLVAGAGKKE
ncbi:MAG TPA: hypothetical protein VFB96_20010 [Pirellulaceae bacterium]|nr:hypothetical protein [Pirellulaceae bacterium]